jgi:murein lipoprotein
MCHTHAENEKYNTRDIIMLKQKSLIKNMLTISFALGLTACSNTEGLDASIASLSNKVDSLSSEVSELKGQHSSISQDAKAAKMSAEKAVEGAAKANERIDNVVASYKK